MSQPGLSPLDGDLQSVIAEEVLTLHVLLIAVIKVNLNESLNYHIELAQCVWSLDSSTYRPPDHAPSSEEETSHGASVGAYHSLKHSRVYTSCWSRENRNMLKQTGLKLKHDVNATIRPAATAQTDPPSLTMHFLRVLGKPDKEWPNIYTNKNTCRILFSPEVVSGLKVMLQCKNLFVFYHNSSIISIIMQKISMFCILLSLNSLSLESTLQHQSALKCRTGTKHK